MRKVSGSRPDGVQDKKEKKKAQEAWVIRRKKEGKRWDTEAENRRKEARESAQSNSLLFIR